MEKEPAKAKEEPQKEEAADEEVQEAPKAIETQYKKLSGPKIMGDKIDLTKFNKPKKKVEPVKKADDTDKKKRRKRIVSNKGPQGNGRGRAGVKKGQRFSSAPKVEPTEEEVQKQVRETLEKLQGKSKKGKGAKYRREKRDLHREQTEKDLEQLELDSKIFEGY